MRFILSRNLRDLPFTPGDWLIFGAIGIVFLIGIFALLAELSFAFTSEVPARGGTYQEVIVGTPRFVNPILALSDADRDLVALTFAGLMRATPDGSLVPELAEGYTLSEDERTYTFTLREDARFHDGTPVTAADVVFTVSLAQNPVLKSPKRANWEGVTATQVDERTVSFTLRDPYALFLENTRIGILPKHLWAGVSPEEMPFSQLNIEPVGAGPYKVGRLVTSSAGIPTQFELEAFDESVRRPYLDSVVLSFVADAEAQRTTLANNPRLAAHSLTPTDFPDRSVHEAVMGRVFSVFFNQNQNELFADEVVRIALDRSLDKQAIVDTLISGYGSPVEGPLPPTSVVVQSVSEEDATVEARALLERNGWEAGEDGILQKTEKKVEKRLSFTLSTGNAPELKAAGELVANAWRALGAEVSTEFFDAADLQQNVIRPRKYAALLFGVVVGQDADLFAFWDSSQRNDPGLNVALYTNTSVDKLLREARAEPDAEKRRALVEAAAAIIEDEQAAVFLYSPHFLFLTPSTISGIELGTIVTPADRFLSVSEWYERTERVWPIFQ